MAAVLKRAGDAFAGRCPLRFRLRAVALTEPSVQADSPGLTHVHAPDRPARSP